MQTFDVDFVGVSELFFGRPVMEKKKADETHEQFEERTWQQKVHVNKYGRVFIQPFALKNALVSAAKWLNKKIPGEGKSTYTKRFRAGVLITDPLPLVNDKGNPVTLKDIEARPLFVPSTGVQGDSKRVIRIFPVLSSWRCTGRVMVFDGKITADILEEHLESVGKFIGFGSMRVQNGGINGRAAIENFREVAA